jgi:hypothetical protein
VIDSGRAKEMQYDAQSNMAMLVEGWASKARYRSEPLAYVLFTDLVFTSGAQKPRSGSAS